VSLDLNFLVTLLFGAGGAGAVAGVTSVVKTLRSGKIENEETLIRRLDADNQKQQKRAEDAERRADQAEKEAEEYRIQRNQAQEQLARVRWFAIQNGLELPKFGGEE
jgi:TolA-binding protein